MRVGSLKGAMAAVMLNVYETWFTSPNQEHTSARCTVTDNLLFSFLLS